MAFWAADLHSDNIQTKKGIIQKGGTIKRVSAKYTFDEKSLNQFLGKLTKDDYIVIENTTNAFWFYDMVKPLVKKCFVIDTNRVEFKGNKTDKIDAGKLLDLLLYHVMLGSTTSFPSVHVPEKEIRYLRGLFTTYRLNTKIKTQLKNRIHSILKQEGICVKRAALDTKKGKQKVLSLNLDETIMFQIEELFEELEYLKEKQKRITERVLILGAKLYKDEINLLLSIPGFSEFTAIAVLSDIADIKRFKNAKQLCSYLRTAPQVKSSNKTTHIGKINKRARTLTCSLLVQSMNHFINCSPYLADIYNRLKNKSHGKARIAVTRKVIEAVFMMLMRRKTFYWVNEEMYKRKQNAFRNKLGKLIKNVA